VPAKHACHFLYGFFIRNDLFGKGFLSIALELKNVAKTFNVLIKAIKL